MENVLKFPLLLIERRTKQRRKIYLQPIGELYGPSVEDFREFIASYFQLEAKVLPAVQIVGNGEETSILKDPWSYPVTTKRSKDFPGTFVLFVSHK